MPFKSNEDEGLFDEQKKAGTSPAYKINKSLLSL
jgi:hypothetical protein